MKIQYFVRGSKEGQNSVDENDDVTLQGIETMQKLEYVTMLHAKGNSLLWPQELVSEAVYEDRYFVS